MKGDVTVGVLLHEKEGEEEDAYTEADNPIPTSIIHASKRVL